jgi:hypothetical protein
MSVQVDEAGRDDKARDIDDRSSRRRQKARTDVGHGAIADSHVGDPYRRAAPVDDPATAEKERAAALRSHS